MDIQKNLNEVEKFKKDLEIRQNQDRLNRSKNKLARLAEKRFKTTFVGALSEFEQGFGHIWKHGIPEEELTDEEYDNRKIWENIRNNILNKSNAQMRGFLTELDQHTIDKNDFTINFAIKDIKEG